MPRPAPFHKGRPKAARKSHNGTPPGTAPRGPGRNFSIELTRVISEKTFRLQCSVANRSICEPKPKTDPMTYIKSTRHYPNAAQWLNVGIGNGIAATVLMADEQLTEISNGVL